MTSDGRSADTVADLLGLAKDAAIAAGELLVTQGSRGAAIFHKSDVGAIVTVADLAAEDLVRATIEARRPHDAVLGEERGAKRGTTGVRWVLDALDGTVNYTLGISEWAVSIAVEIDMLAVAAVVHAPRLHRTFTAVAGAGAWCNGLRLPLRPAATDLGDAVVATGFAPDPRCRGHQLARLERVLPNVRDVRMRGAASLELCAVAAGELDAYFEADLRPWDSAAGCLIATESGRRVVRDDPSGADPLVAAAEPIADELLALLAGSRVGG